MKTGFKIALWSIVSGGIGFFGGWTVCGRRIVKLQEQLDIVRDKERELEEIASILAGEVPEAKEEKKPDPKAVQNAYLGKTDTDEDAEMPEEKPVIGDEDTVEKSPAVEIITEEEYYENSCGYPQEELIWYALDEVLWNKDTQSKVSTEDANTCLGYNTLHMFDIDLLNQNPPEVIYVKNHIIPGMFMVSYMDAAWVDEHQQDETDDD